MKYEPTAAIHMEKQLGWSCKLGGTESPGISRAGKTMLVRLMESRIWPQLAGSVGGVFRRTMVSAHLDARHFCLLHFLPIYHWCLQTGTLVLKLIGNESE